MGGRVALATTATDRILIQLESDYGMVINLAIWPTSLPFNSNRTVISSLCSSVGICSCSVDPDIWLLKLAYSQSEVGLNYSGAFASCYGPMIRWLVALSSDISTALIIGVWRDTIIKSMLPSTKDPWPRTVLVCAEGMVTKIKKISLRLKHECPCMGFEVSRELIPDARSGLTEKARSPSLSLVDWLTRSMLTLWVVNLT